MRTRSTKTTARTLQLRGSAALVAVLTLNACGGGSGGASDSAPGVTDTTITLGASSPLTGVPAAGCARVHNGALSWFKKVNAEGGVNGRTIDWKILDDGYDLARAGQNARKLIDGDYFAVFGGCGSIQPPAIVPVIEKAKVPYLFPMAQVPDLYLPTKKYAFAFSPSWAAMFNSIVPWALKEKGSGSVATIFAENASIDSAVKAVESATTASGGEYLGAQVVPPATTDWTPFVLKLKQQQPDYVVLNFSVEVALKFQQAAEDQGFEPKKAYLNTISLMGDEFVKALTTSPGKTKLDGKVISAYQVATPDDPGNADCVAAAKKYAPDMVPDGNLMAGCNSARWMVEILKKAGKDLTRDKLLEVLQTINNEKLSPGAVAATITADDHLAPSSIYIYELKGNYVRVGEVPLEHTL